MDDAGGMHWRQMAVMRRDVRGMFILTREA